MQRNGFCRTLLLSQAEPWSLCSILSPPPPICKTKKQKEEEASLQVELCTEAPGSLQLMRGHLYSDAASAYTSTRENTMSEAEAQNVRLVSYFRSV